MTWQPEIIDSSPDYIMIRPRSMIQPKATFRIVGRRFCKTIFGVLGTMLSYMTIRLFIFPVLIFAVMISPASAQLNRIVGFDGDSPPDGNGTIYYFFNLVLNDDGQLAFSALLENTSGDANWAIFMKEGTTTTRVVRKPEPAPDGNGTFSTFDTFALTNSGFVVFDARLDGTSGGSDDNNGIFLNDGNVVHQIARESSPVPDGDGTYRFFRDPQINESGQVTFGSTLQGTSNGSSNDNAIFIGTTSQILEVAREGDLIPDGTARFESFRETFINNSGEITFKANGTGSFDDGIYFYDGADMFQIVRELADIPDGSGRFDLIYQPVLNDLGQMAFRALLDQTTGGSNDNEGLYFATTSEIVEVVRKGQASPDGMGTYRRFLDARLTQFGQMFVNANVDYDGNIDDVLLGGNVHSLEVILREGDPSPDGNGTFSSLMRNDSNEAGQVVFFAVLDNTANGFDDNYGIFFWDKETGVHKIVREGDSMLGNTIVDFNSRSQNSSPCNRSGLNELGQVVYRFELANGQVGAAVWTKPLAVESLQVDSGLVLTGSVNDLGISDDVGMAIVRDAASIQSVVEFTVKSNVPFSSTTDLQFLLEANVFARSEITQSIEWFNYEVNEFQVIDSRPASRFTDQETSVTPTGDISRFIEPGTGCVEARVRFSSSLNRTRFAARIDRIWWNATNW